MRTRLTDTERAERKRERSRHSFSDAAYRHYDPNVEGYGSPDDWERIAEMMFGRVAGNGDGHGYLETLGLARDAKPTPAELKAAFRAAMFKAHPDHGGSDAKARGVLEAYEILRKAA